MADGVDAGDGEAFRALLREHGAVIEARIRRLLPARYRRRVSVQDVLQETRVAIHEALPRFEPREGATLRAWALAIAENKTREAIRHHGAARRALRREASRGSEARRSEPRAPGRSPSEEAAAAEARDLLERALAALPPDHARVLRWTRLEGLTLAEASERMGRTREAVKKLHGRALLGLSGILAREQRRGR